MKKLLLLGCASALCMSFAAPATAFDVSANQTLCPIESMDQAEMEKWGAELKASNGEFSNDQAAAIFAATHSCGEKHNWTEAEVDSALTFNISILVATALEERLTDLGVDASEYESVLNDMSPDALRDVLASPENSPAMQEVVALLIKNKGEDVSEEISNTLGGYIGFMAQSQLSAFEMMGVGE